MNLTDPRFQDPEKAREYLEAQRWPDGPVCPHCGNCDHDSITSLKGKAHRPGLYQCNACREQFTVTVGSVMEDSKIPLNKWLLAMHFLGASKKGMSAHQLHRMLGITYQSAWFLAHRIREAMTDQTPSPIGGANKVVEADEVICRRQSQKPRIQAGTKEAYRHIACRAWRRSPFVPCQERNRKDASRNRSQNRQPQIISGNRRKPRLHDARQRIRWPWNREPFGKRICAPRRLHSRQ